MTWFNGVRFDDWFVSDKDDKPKRSREELQADVEAFLASGNKVETLPGFGANDTRKSTDHKTRFSIKD